MAYKSWDERIADRIAVNEQTKAAAMGVELTPLAARLLADERVADHTATIDQQRAANRAQRSWEKANGTPATPAAEWTAEDYDAYNYL